VQVRSEAFSDCSSRRAPVNFCIFLLCARFSAPGTGSLAETGKDLPQHMLIKLVHELLFIFIIFDEFVCFGTVFNAAALLDGRDRLRLYFILKIAVIFYPFPAVIMAADAGKNQPIVPLQPDQPEAAGEVVFAAVPQTQLAVVRAPAGSFLIQRIGLQAADDPLCPFSNGPFFFPGFVQSLKLLPESTGLMNFKLVHLVISVFIYSG
jgi:hypothetical protein